MAGTTEGPLLSSAWLNTPSERPLERTVLIGELQSGYPLVPFQAMGFRLGPEGVQIGSIRGPCFGRSRSPMIPSQTSKRGLLWISVSREVEAKSGGLQGTPLGGVPGVPEGSEGSPWEGSHSRPVRGV